MLAPPPELRARPAPFPVGRGMCALALAAVALAVLGNALSPVGIAWRHDWQNDAWNRALESGYRPLTPAQAAEIVRAGDALVIDARDPESYALGHLPGAVPVPWQIARTFLEANAEQIPAETPVLVYCSHAQCDAALVVADFFREWRFANISVLVSGFEGWQTHGGPVAKGLDDE